MKAMYAAFAAIVVIAIGADYALDYAGFSTQDQVTTSSSVRLD